MLALCTGESQRSVCAHKTHQRGHKDASHDVCACVFACTWGALHLALKSIHCCSGGSSVTHCSLFPSKRASHSQYIDCQHLMRPLKVCRMQWARSTLVKGRYRSSYRTTIDAGQGDASLQTAVVMKDKYRPGVKFSFIAFLPRTSFTVLSAVIWGLFVFAVGDQNSAGSLCPEEKKLIIHWKHWWGISWLHICLFCSLIHLFLFYMYIF